ncbi:antitermination protein N, partial [Cronobacter sakazakii]
MSRRTEFKGSSAARRRERRAHMQSADSISSEVMHRPTPSKVELQCKRKVSMRA